MPEKEKRQRYDSDFRNGAVRAVRETGHVHPPGAEDLGIIPGALAHWVMRDKVARGEKQVRALGQELAYERGHGILSIRGH
jgi:transposase-like protein